MSVNNSSCLKTVQCKPERTKVAFEMEGNKTNDM